MLTDSGNNSKIFWIIIYCDGRIYCPSAKCCIHWKYVPLNDQFEVHEEVQPRTNDRIASPGM
jgi:hypothetical protein